MHWGQIGNIVPSTPLGCVIPVELNGITVA